MTADGSSTDANRSAVSIAAEFRRGWPVILGSIAGVGVGGASLSFYTAGIFLKELQGALGWTRTEVAAGSLVFMLTLAVALPFVGGLIDRFGVRRPVAISLAAMAIGFTAFSLLLHSFVVFLLLQAVLALACAPSTPIAFTRAVNDWFVRGRGLALGLTLAGTGIVAAAAPPLLTMVIASFGWRAGYAALAAVLLVAAPLVLWLVRLDPANTANIPLSEASDAQVFATARRSRTFRMLMAAFFMLSLGCSGLIVHLVPLLTDAGVSGAKAASIASLSGLSVLGGRLLVGYLVDRFPAIYVAAIGLGLSAAGCLSLAFFGVGAAPAAAIAIGFAIGAEVDLIGFLTAAYFGLRAYGRLFGWQYGVFVLGTGLGPLWVAAVYDHTGSYQIAVYGVAALLLAAAALFLACPRYAAPTRRSASAPEKREASTEA